MRPRRLELEGLRQAIRRQPGITAGELRLQLEVSQPTISRGLALLGEELIRFGDTRKATRLALPRRVGRWGSEWPLHRIDSRGQATQVGSLQAVGSEGWFYRPEHPQPAWLHGEFSAGLFPDLPWFLEDMRPQGFLGRSFVHAHARELEAPDELNLWRSDHVLAALLSHGDNLPGDLVLGEPALEQALRDMLDPPDAIEPDQRTIAYPQRAQAASQGRPSGSSAGGEQPKFTAVLEDGPERRRAVIVKFSEPVADSASARRWADLLLCEHLAGLALQEIGIAAAPTEVLDASGRRFLQSQRFDRTPVLGRRGYTSLRSLDAAWFGAARKPWSEMAEPLLRAGWITEDTAEAMRVIDLFGALIGNTDMHFGNLAFELQDSIPFGLVPVFDMLPMLYAPSSTGAIVARDFDPPPPLPRQRSAWQRAARAALRFWQSVAGSPLISADFQGIAGDNAQRIDRLLGKFG